MTFYVLNRVYLGVLYWVVGFSGSLTVWVPDSDMFSVVRVCEGPVDLTKSSGPCRGRLQVVVLTSGTPARGPRSLHLTLDE